MSDGGHTVGDGYGGKTRTTRESITIDESYTIGDGYGGQAGTA